MDRLNSLKKLLIFWDKKGVSIKKPLSNVDLIKHQSNLELPGDFFELYSYFDGTLDYDDEGFLFYSRSNLMTMGQKFSLSNEDVFFDVVIFCDYMQASWWYGFRITDVGYEIGLIPSRKEFCLITNSLNSFIDLYMNDSELLCNIS
jgi:hypothetical protein